MRREFMGKYVVELSDVNGLSCRVSLSLPVLKNGTDPYNSSWKILDEGFLKFRSGGCHMVDTTPGNIITDGNLLLCAGQYHGVNLHRFVGSLGLANDSGMGVLYQPWAVNGEPGQITWELL